MEITCQSCSTRMAIPDENIPKNVPAIRVQCPKCQQPIDIPLTAATPAPAGNGSPLPQGAAAPPAAPRHHPPEPATPHVEEEFVGDRRLAMACFDSPQQQAAAKAALEALGFTVHVPAKGDEALRRLGHNKYELLLLHEEYGGSAEGNPVHTALRPMAMAHRRHMCIGLVGKTFRTIDHMMAFAKSVNFVVAERELDKIEAITRQAMADNDQFYKVFRETLTEAGRT